MAEKKYVFVKRSFGSVYYRAKEAVDGAVEEARVKEGGKSVPGYASNKEFLIAEVENYATNYIPPPSLETPAPTLLPALPGVNPYRIEVLEEGDALKSIVYFSNQLIQKREYVKDYTAIVGGEKFESVAAVTAEIENLIKTTGIFADALAYPAFKEDEEKVDPEAEAKAKAEELEKLAAALEDPLAALIPTEDDILEILAEKEPMIAAMIKLLQQKKLEREESGMSKEEAEEKFKADRDKMIDDYKTALKDMVKAELKKIKTNIGVFTTAVKNIPPAIVALVTNTALPAALGPVAPNPVHALNTAAFVIKQLQIILQGALVAFGIILAGSLILKIKLPEPLVTTYDVMLTISGLLEAVPLP